VNTRLDPIDSQIFNLEIPIDGILLLMDHFIRFEPRDNRQKPKMLPLSALVSSSIEPHPYELTSPDELIPEDSITLLKVNLMLDPNNPDKIDEFLFAGKLLELVPFQDLMERRAAAAQSASSFVRPHDKPDSPAKVSPPSRPVFGAEQSSVLPSEKSSILRESLPYRLRRYDWKMLYRMSRDGSSFLAFSNALLLKEATILMIRLTSGEIIGAFTKQGFTQEKSRGTSTGEAFVFSFSETFEFSCHQWSRAVPFFCSASDSAVIVGGGSYAAIWMDGNLLRGFSEKCTAFNSPPLVSKSPFQVVELEIWQVSM
jgi:hypothetical protein